MELQTCSISISVISGNMGSETKRGHTLEAAGKSSGQ
jgi:hypothetical protein